MRMLGASAWPVRCDGFVAGNSHAFVCNDDEECAAAAAKEARNPATNFLWTQLRALAALLEQRSWHRRALTRAEVAAGLQHTANGAAHPQAAAAGSAAAEDPATPLKIDDDEESEEGELDAVPAQQQNGAVKRKRHSLASHPIQISPVGAAVSTASPGGTPAKGPDTAGQLANGSAAGAASPSQGVLAEANSLKQSEPAATPEAGDKIAGAGQVAGSDQALSPEAALAREREVAAADEAAMEQILKQLDERLGRIHDALPTNAMLIVAAGQGDTAEVRRLQVRYLYSSMTVSKCRENWRSSRADFQRTGLIYSRSCFSGC